MLRKKLRKYLRKKLKKKKRVRNKTVLHSPDAHPLFFEPVEWRER